MKLDKAFWLPSNKGVVTANCFSYDITLPGSFSSSIVTSHDIAIGAASDSAKNHISTIITFATRLEVWALEQKHLL